MKLTYSYFSFCFSKYFHQAMLASLNELVRFPSFSACSNNLRHIGITHSREGRCWESDQLDCPMIPEFSLAKPAGTGLGRAVLKLTLPGAESSGASKVSWFWASGFPSLNFLFILGLALCGIKYSCLS